MVDDLTGYSLRSAFSDKDIAYETALSVAKATNDFLRTKQEKGYTTFVTVFPVIVLDAPLIRCSLANDGRIELQEIQQGDFLFRAYLPEHFATRIRVTTLKRLPEFTHEAKMVVGFLRSELRDEERRIWEKEFGRPYPEAIANLSLGQAKN